MFHGTNFIGDYIYTHIYLSIYLNMHVPRIRTQTQVKLKSRLTVLTRLIATSSFPLCFRISRSQPGPSACPTARSALPGKYQRSRASEQPPRDAQGAYTRTRGQKPAAEAARGRARQKSPGREGGPGAAEAGSPHRPRPYLVVRARVPDDVPQQHLPHRHPGHPLALHGPADAGPTGTPGPAHRGTPAAGERPGQIGRAHV